MKKIIIVLWVILGISYWAIAKYLCADRVSTEDHTTHTESPFYFGFGTSEIHIQESFERYVDSLRSSMGPNDKLRITGLLSVEEAKMNKSLGTLRAEALSKALAIDADRIILESKTVDHLSLGQRSVEVNRISGESSIVQHAVPSTGDINQHSTIYFPFNSTDKLDDARVEVFLDGIARRVQGTGERILLIGHTDQIGSRRYNYALGDRRAKSIKYYLVSRGVNPQRIITQSRGELNLVDDGDSTANVNRRTEVKLLR